MHQRERLARALSGRYTIERELGQGGMAIVYKAHDTKHDRPVAIKVFKPELAHALGPDRFLREIKVTAQLSHPHILPLLDSGEADGLLYFVMPYVEGETLRHRIDREKQLPLDDALRITREVADGLESAHRRGVIHRDVKPENILIEEGHAVVADFGIARAVAESADSKLTGTGIAIGTPDYMSPEQRLAGRAGPIDARTDVFALGKVLQELVGAEAPEDVQRVIRRATSEDPAERYASAAEMVAALPRPSAKIDDLGAIARLIRRPAYAVPLVVLVLVVAGAIVLPGRARARAERGRTQLARAAQLADSGRYREAYAAFEQAERALPGDSAVRRVQPLVADVISVTSEPSGARVYARPFSADSSAAPDSVLLGETPIRARRFARGDYRLVITKQGFHPMATLSVAWGSRPQRSGYRTGATLAVDVRLAPQHDSTKDMAFVPGGAYTLVGPSMPLGLKAQLADFFIDAYEVSNQDYRAFVSAGGYRRAELARFTDRSGMPGPRGWTGQQFPPELARHPVTGVSWGEASAYCASRGKRLPTLFEWEKTARNGVTAIGTGVLLPWGYVSPGEGVRPRANFGSSGTAPVDAYPFGISIWGAHNMAGNVKEWTANPVPGGYGVTGGSWEDPIYLYNRYGALAPTASSAALGFRCARLATPSAAHDQGAFRIPLDSRTPVYHPVSPAQFATLLQHYRYDARPLEPAVLDTVVTPDWTRLKIRFVVQDGDTALGYLYLPKQARPPYQTIVYLASTAAFLQARTVPEEAELMIGPNIRAGRAAFALVLRGMTERPFGIGWESPDPASVRFRDLMVLHATELRRGLDYLVTRADIDSSRLAYAALSWGAGSRLVLAGVDDRFKAVVLMGGGIDERLSGPALPEASSINFAPYIRAPKILINGGYDEEDPWLTRALPLWQLLREPKQLVLAPGYGHSVPPEVRVPAINRFLDRWLGTVK
ncbi:MAG TPA: SUMF1/EgtB/PvdO family nonheme iron enzyme [Gemmatimonadales bacterium]|nr:SUMF1/EgtB/PvdO family nonheme iron enzyme [Gemmatimonadales bacterium]